MADIKVGLKLATGELRQQAREAGRVLRDEVGGGGSGGGGGKKRSVLDWIAEQNANKAAGGVFRRGGGYAPPASGVGGGGGGAAAGGGMMAAGFAGGIAGALVSVLPQIIARMVQAIKNAIISAFREASSLYAKQLTSGGLPGGFITRRSSLAQIIGVSERDVLRFGSAVRYLNTHLDYSTKVLATTTRNLASVTWWFRILGKDVAAIAATISNDLAPGIRKALYAVHIAISSLGDFLARSFATMVKGVIKTLASVLPGGRAMIDAIDRMVQSLPDPGKAPGAAVDSNRLPASPWERMGLIIGGGISGNPMRATERNTRNTVIELKKIVGMLGPRQGGGPNLPTAAVSSP